MRIKGSRVVVTGASSGIGRLTALALARRGAAEVVAAARSAGALEALAAEHPAIRPEEVDLADRGARERFAARLGPVDVLVNNAGVGWLGLVEDMPQAALRRLYEVNVLAPIELTQAVLPGMLERRRGRVVNVSSAAAWVAHPPLSVYGSTKWALQGFSEGLRRELNARGVAVATVNPGPVRTPFAEAARQGNRPNDTLEEARMPGIPATWVAGAVVRAVRLGALPGYQTIAVPRLMGLSRLGGAPVTGWTVDVVTLATVRLRLGRERRAEALARTAPVTGGAHGTPTVRANPGLTGRNGKATRAGAADRAPAAGGSLDESAQVTRS